MKLAIAVAALVVVAGCKKERPRTTPAVVDSGGPAIEDEQALRDHYYGGCAIDADAGAAGNDATRAVVAGTWLAAHGVTGGAPCSGSQPCRCDRELVFGSRSFLVCTTEDDSVARTVFYAAVAGKLRTVFDAPTGTRPSHVEWVPADVGGGHRKWPPPIISLVPTVWEDRLVFIEASCPLCNAALSVLRERQAGEALRQPYEAVCETVGDWSWSGDRIVQTTTKFPELKRPPPVQ